MPVRAVTLQIPATTANLGPGFDCLGMALDLFNTISVRSASAFSLSIAGEGAAGNLSRGRDNLVYVAFQSLYQRLRLPVPPVALCCENRIPLSRGLGSSAAAVVGGLVAANECVGQPLGLQELLKIAVDLEGHPDNVTPALLGGCQVVVTTDQGILASQVPIAAELRAVLFIPDFEMSTRQARKVLAAEVSRADAVFNIGRAALLVNALATGQFEHLRAATQDRLHQPARQALFPGMKVIFDAALYAGALGVFLSGAGSTVLALAQGREMTIAYYMAEAAEKAGFPGRTLVTRPTSQGACVVRRE